MYVHEPVMFHKSYPLDSFLEEARRMEKERELMYSYLPEEYRRIQRKVEEVCDQMEYEGSRMYDEHPDSQVIRGIARKIMKDLQPGRVEESPIKDKGKNKIEQIEKGGCVDGRCQPERYLEDISCCFLCNEILRRRYRAWRSKQYI